MEKEQTTSQTRLDEIRDLPPKLTLSEQELRLISGGRATARPISTCGPEGDDGD